MFLISKININSDLSDSFTISHSLCWATSQTEFTNVTLTAPITDYKMIYLCAAWYSNLRGVLTISPVILRQMGGIHLTVYFYNNHLSTEYVYFKYVDDNTIAIQTNFANVRAQIIGIK